jgi:hypothetical protein
MKHPILQITPRKTKGLRCRDVGSHGNPSPNSTGHGFYKPTRKRQAVTETDDISGVRSGTVSLKLKPT